MQNKLGCRYYLVAYDQILQICCDLRKHFWIYNECHLTINDVSEANQTLFVL